MNGVGFRKFKKQAGEPPIHYLLRCSPVPRDLKTQADIIKQRNILDGLLLVIVSDAGLGYENGFSLYTEWPL